MVRVSMRFWVGVGAKLGQDGGAVSGRSSKQDSKWGLSLGQG